MELSFGQYEVRDELGEGKLGRVYLAEDTRLGRQVALKVLYEDAFGSQRDLKRCTADAYTVGAINHPNIGDIYDVGRTAKSLYLASEYIRGETLRDRLKKSRLTVPQALDIAIQIGTALREAHRRRIIHRDIKPENVMLLPTGVVKVVDFGLARLSGPSAERGGYTAHIGAAENLLTRVCYLSPEELRGRSIDRRSDLWSLGALLYEMISGQAPFVASTTSNLEYSILKDQPVPLRSAPPELERIVNKAMNKSRWSRYQTAKEMIRDLEEVRRRMTFGIGDTSLHDTRLKKGLIHRIRDRLVGAAGIATNGAVVTTANEYESGLDEGREDARRNIELSMSESSADLEAPEEGETKADEVTLFANLWIEDSDRIPVALPVRLLTDSSYLLLFGIGDEIRIDALSSSEFQEPSELQDRVYTDIEIHVTCDLLPNESGRETRVVKYHGGYGFSPEAFYLGTGEPGKFFATVRLFYLRTILFRKRIPIVVENPTDFISLAMGEAAAENDLEIHR